MTTGLDEKHSLVSNNVGVDLLLLVQRVCRIIG